jgi:hypothetical protein
MQMKRLRMQTFKRWILPAIALIFLCMPAISPFLHEGMPLTDDGNLHLYRGIALDHSIRNDGALYPRFASGLVYGYGAPLFNYFPPSSYYPTVIFHIFGFSWIDAWKATMIFYVLLAGFGAYLLGKEWAGEAGGYIAAAAYIYAPYALFDTVSRGTSSEYAAMAFLPFALWAFSRLAKQGSRLNPLIATLSFAAFILMHTLMTLFGTVFLMLFCGALWLSSKEKMRLLWQMGLAGLLALLLTAFFWWPALAETDFVKIDGVVENLDFIDVTQSLRRITEVFALPKTADPTQLQAVIPISFGWPALLLALLAVWQRDRWLVFCLWLIVAGTVFLQLEASASFWQSIPFLRYSQFAWRTMSIGTLALALLAGMGGGEIVNRISRKWLKRGVFCVFLAILVLYSVSWLYRPSSNLQAESIADAQNYEIQTGSLTLSSYSEYLPIWNLLNPPLEFSRRLQPNPAVAVSAEAETGTSANITLNSSKATLLVFNWLYFLGWEATVDGQSVEVFPAGDAGLVGINIEAGQHEIRLSYGMTSTQRNATILSVVALIALGFILFLWHDAASQVSHEPSQFAWPVIGISLSLFLLKILVIDMVDSPFKTERFQNGQIAGLTIPLNANFGGEIALLGAEAVSSVKSGEMAEIRLFWTPLVEDVTTDYSTRLTLQDLQGNIVSETGSFYPADLATSNWRQGFYLEEIINLPIPPYTLPADYSIHISLYQSQSGEVLELRNAENNPIGVDMVVSQIIATRPDSFPPYSVSLGQEAQGLRLLQINGLPNTAQVGDEFSFYWLWEDLGHETKNLELAWGDAATVSLKLGTNWQVGDIWRVYERVYVPATLDAGDYSLSVLINGEAISIGQMTVTEPERNFEIPSPETKSAAKWQNGIRLLGYDRLENGYALYWQPQDFVPESLRLFVQVQDENGQISAVSDAIPVDWTRPTSGWYPEEVIRTEHHFDNLPANYRLLIGWYRPNSNERILLDNGIDVLIIEAP